MTIFISIVCLILLYFEGIRLDTFVIAFLLGVIADILMRLLRGVKK